MASTPLYNPWQTTFYLSMLSNSVSDTLIVTSEQTDAQNILAAMLTQKVNAAFADSDVMSLIGGDWVLTWGPGVYATAKKATPDNFLSANAAFVCYSPSLGRYVLAIAATDPLSTSDWVAEDLVLVPGWSWDSALTNWNSWTNPTAKPLGSSTTPTLTSATYNGVGNVLALQGIVASTQATSSLLTYLASTLALKTTEYLTVTGHSLGGALSPTLAMALVVGTKSTPKLTPLPIAQVGVYATAGATPGNQLLAQQFASNFPSPPPTTSNFPQPPTTGAQPWQVWNADVVNQFDIVPAAWGSNGETGYSSGLSGIKTNYDKSLEYSNNVGSTAFIDGLILFAEGISVDWTGTGILINNGAFGYLTRATINLSASVDDAFAWNCQIPIFNNSVLQLSGAQITAYNNAANSANQIAVKSAITDSNQIGYQHIAVYMEAILGAPPTQPQTLS